LRRLVVMSMWVESSECTKLGGKAERCRDDETGSSSWQSTRTTFCTSVLTWAPVSRR
jgi:hypothetical protein